MNCVIPWTSEQNDLMYNGKEFQLYLINNQELAWLDYEARFMDPALGRWHVQDPMTENYLSLSPYNYVANNPLLFIDPNGENLILYAYDWNEDNGWQRKQVKFNDLDKNLQKALEAFAKTDAGYSFFKDFANEGDKIGSVQFTEKGKYAEHDLEVVQFNQPQAAYGESSMRNGNNKLIFNMQINTSRNTEDQNVEGTAITIGHESFIHFKQYMHNAINAYNKNDKNRLSEIYKQQENIGQDRNGGPDHDGYIAGNQKHATMRLFVSQLKTVLNPTQVNKQIKAHDNKYKKQIKQ